MRIMANVFFIFFLILSSCSCQKDSDVSPTAVHRTYDALLKKYVNEEGLVDYEGFKTEQASLKAYLENLSNNFPTPSWTQHQKMSYWINAYNAFTIDLVLQHWPLQSILDIQEDSLSPWDIPFIVLDSTTFTLNHIEHEILRKEFNDPRIHFAVNCASFSCPIIRNEIVSANALDAQLDAMAKDFINDTTRNKITAQKAELSQIFNWFKDDFQKDQALYVFINQYSQVPILEETPIVYLDYNWSVNVQED